MTLGHDSSRQIRWQELLRSAARKSARVMAGMDFKMLFIDRDSSCRAVRMYILGIKL